MKSIGLSFVMAGLLLTSCRRPVAQTEDPSAPESVATTQAPSPASAPLALPGRSDAAPPTLSHSAPFPDAPPTRELAPPGVFYLLVAVRKDTKDGILRLLPGTEVRLGKNGKFITPDGEMTLDPSILTNDMAQARIARRADKLAQAAAYPQGLPATSAPPTAAGPSIPAAPAAAWSASTTSSGSMLFSATPAPQADSSSIRALKFRLAVLKGEEAKLQANLDYLSDKSTHPYRSGRGAPEGLNASTNLTDWNLIAEKLDAVRTEIQSLEAKLGVSAN